MIKRPSCLYIFCAILTCWSLTALSHQTFPSLCQDTELPRLVGNKSPTLNGMGYVFYTPTPMGELFLEQEALPGHHVFEIGSGYGNIPIEALRKGISSYTAFDLSPEHLELLKQRILQALGSAALERINFISGNAPRDLPYADRQFDAILLDKIIHFLTPEEIIQTLHWSKNALKPGGAIYASTVSPYGKHYNQCIRDDYESRQAAGERFPGATSKIMDSLDTQNMQNHPELTLPDSMVLFTRPDLIRLLQSEGFIATHSFSLKHPNADNAQWQNVPVTESTLAEVVAR